MDKAVSFDRVHTFLEELPKLPVNVIESRVKEIENDIYILFSRLERLHTLYPELKQVDLSEDIYSLARMLKPEKVQKQFPLLARAAAMFF
ncbi:MAG: hypothetical protein V1871_03660 [Planctomycetota bacterium]